MAAFYVTGPAHIFVRLPAAGALGIGGQGAGNLSWRYLGTAEIAPTVRIMPTYSPVLNDVGGPTVATDMIFDGAVAMIVGDMNRLDMDLARGIVNYPRYSGAPSEYGQTKGDQAVLMVQEPFHCSYQLLIAYPYYNTPNHVPGLPPGYYFYNVATVGPVDLDQGSRVQKWRFVWLAQRALQTDLSFKLYSQDPTLFTGLIVT